MKVSLQQFNVGVVREGEPMIILHPGNSQGRSLQIPLLGSRFLASFSLLKGTNDFLLFPEVLCHYSILIYKEI